MGPPSEPGHLALRQVISFERGGDRERGWIYFAYQAEREKPAALQLPARAWVPYTPTSSPGDQSMAQRAIPVTPVLHNGGDQAGAEDEETQRDNCGGPRNQPPLGAASQY